MYFSKLRHEDMMMSFEQIDKFDEGQIDKLCYMRGIQIDDKTQEQKLKDLKLWMSISNLRNVPHTLLLYSRITEFSEDLFQIYADEDEYEVLRRVSGKMFIFQGRIRDLLYRKVESI